MTTRHLVDPELAGSLDMFPTVELTNEMVVQMRAMMEEMRSNMAPNLPTFPDISVSEHLVPGPEGSPLVRVLLYVPTTVQVPLPALLWIHGGGYVLGTADQDDVTVKSIVSAVGCAAVSVDYRLAPETRRRIQGQSRIVIRHYTGYIPTPRNWAWTPLASLLVERAREEDWPPDWHC